MKRRQLNECQFGDDGSIYCVVLRTGSAEVDLWGEVRLWGGAGVGPEGGDVGVGPWGRAVGAIGGGVHGGGAVRWDPGGRAMGWVQGEGCKVGNKFCCHPHLSTSDIIGASLCLTHSGWFW